MKGDRRARLAATDRQAGKLQVGAILGNVPGGGLTRGPRPGV